MIDLLEEPSPLIDSARSKSLRPKPPNPRAPALMKLLREIPSQFLNGPPLTRNIIPIVTFF